MQSAVRRSSALSLLSLLPVVGTRFDTAPLTATAQAPLIPVLMWSLNLLLVLAVGLPPLEVDQARSLIMSEIEQRFDQQHGALQERQKFPIPALSDALLLFSYRRGSPRHLQMATLTLDRMCSQALYDHLGGGFFNHTRDSAWQMPRFLRNTTLSAALMSVYLRAYRQTGVQRYAEVATGCRDFLLGEALQPNGSFRAGIGGSGEPWVSYYTWTRAELDAALPPRQAELVALHWGITREGPNRGPLRGRSVPRIARPLTSVAAALSMPLPEAHRFLEEARRSLLGVRRQRHALSPAPAVNAEANAAAVIGLVDAAELSQDASALPAALRAAELLLEYSLTQEEGVFGVVPLDGAEPSHFGSLLTNALVGLAFTRVYFATYRSDFLDAALSIISYCRSRLWSDSERAFVDYTDESDVPRLGEARVNVNDMHLMSANSLMALFLEELALATDKEFYHQWALAALVAGARHMPGRAHRAASYLIAADRWQYGRVLVTVPAAATDLAAAARGVYLPWVSVAELTGPPPFGPSETAAGSALLRAPGGTVRSAADAVALESALRVYR